MFLDPNTMQYYDSGAINIKTIEYYKVQYLIDLCCRTLQAFFPDELPPHCVELLDLTPGLICPFLCLGPLWPPQHLDARHFFVKSGVRFKFS